MDKHQQSPIRFTTVPSSASGCDHNRCILKRLGRGHCRVTGSTSTNSMSGDLVSTAGGSSYKPFGVESSFSSSEVFPVSHQEQNRSSEVGQYHGLHLHQQDGGDKVPATVSGSDRSVGLVLASQHRSSISSHTGGRQHSRGCSVQTDSAGTRMESSFSDSQHFVQDVGQASNRSICIRSQPENSQLLFSIPRPQCLHAGRLFNRLGQVFSRVCVPSTSDSTSCCFKDQEGQSQSDFNSPQLATEELVQSNSSFTSRGSVTAPRLARPIVTKQNTTPQTVKSVPSSVESQRGFLRNKGFSQKVVDTMLSARKPSTRALYNAKWHKFCDWCSEGGIDPTLADVPIICQFLQYLYDEGFKYTTITGYVSAISTAHPLFIESSLGTRREIVQFLKGVHNLRPTIQCVVPKWDLQLVLKVFTGSPFEPMESATLQFLTWKTVFLVAVTSAARVSELQALDCRPELLRLFSHKVVLRANPAFLPKVVNTEYLSREIELQAFLPFSSDFPADKLATLCPVRAIKLYLDRTKPFRKDNNLFCSYALGHQGFKVTSQSISRWVRDAICFAYQQQGIQIPRSEIKAHSTRAVAASLASIQGVSPRDLCKAAMWSDTSVFAKFYRLDMLAAKEMSNAILRGAFDH